MTYEEYQSLSADEKMIARIRSLDNVVQASNFDLVLDEQVLERVSATKGEVVEGTIISTGESNTVVVKVESRSTHPLFKKAVRMSKTGQLLPRNTTIQVGEEVFIQGKKSIARNVKPKPADRK